MSRLRYPKEILDAIFDQAREAYPSECCGLLSGYRGQGEPEAVAIHQMENVYDRYHAVDPEAYPRSSRTAFLMDPHLQTRLTTTLEALGTPVQCIYHSHVDDAGARSSEEDGRDALGDGRLEVEHLVVGLRKGAVSKARSYAWDGEHFVGRDVPLEGE